MEDTYVHTLDIAIPAGLGILRLIAIVAAFGMIVFLTAASAVNLDQWCGLGLGAGLWGCAMSNTPQIQTGLNSPLWPPMWGLWCAVFHRRHHRARIVGLFDCEVECGRCGRLWMAN
jgi:hypothetical protein